MGSSAIAPSLSLSQDRRKPYIHSGTGITANAMDAERVARGFFILGLGIVVALILACAAFMVAVAVLPRGSWP